METLGSLIDKLCIVNMKEWHQEDIKRKPNATDKEIADATRKTNILNKQRSSLIQEIDQYLEDVLSGKRKHKHFNEADTKIYGE